MDLFGAFLHEMNESGKNVLLCPVTVLDLFMLLIFLHSVSSLSFQYSNLYLFPFKYKKFWEFQAMRTDLY